MRGEVEEGESRRDTGAGGALARRALARCCSSRKNNESGAPPVLADETTACQPTQLTMPSPATAGAPPTPLRAFAVLDACPTQCRGCAVR